MKGFIKVNRSILDWEWFDDSHMVHLWLYLLVKANHEDKEWHGTTINRGQVVCSYESISVSTGMSVRSIRTCIQRLIDSKQIDKQSTSKNSIITICNYDKYQINDCLSESNNDKQNDNQTAIKRQSNDNKQEYKEYKEEYKEEPKGSKKDEDSISYQHILDYWNAKTSGIFNPLRSIDNRRRESVRARISAYGIDTFLQAIDLAVSSDFLRSWAGFSFDWMIKPNNFDKLIAGNYNRQATLNFDNEPEKRQVSSRGVEPVRRTDDGRFIDATGVIFRDATRTDIIGLEDELKGVNGYEPRKLLVAWFCDPQYGMHGETTYNGKRYWITRWNTIVVDGQEKKL